MRIVGLMPVRNEDWCLGLTARAALMWCDELVMLNHASSDDTSKIIFSLSVEIGRTIPMIRGGEWNEMEHRQAMLETARGWDATHVAIIDADELLTGNLLDTAPSVHGGGATESYIRNMVGVTRPGHVLQLPGYNLRGSLDRYHANGIWGNRWFSTAFPDDPALRWTGDRFHQREPQGIPLRSYRPVHQGQGGVLHLWGLSERRLKAKHALYKLTERLRWPRKSVLEIDGMYNLAIKEPPRPAHPWEYAITPQDWLVPYAHLMQYLHVDAVPWQEAECARLLAEHPGLGTRLDLFGVVG